MPLAPLNGLAPVLSSDIRVMILGSFPGRESLAARQYYAHPRNAFWRIQAALFDEEFTLDYETRLLRLKRHGIALWDSVASCVRPGSLDTAITQALPNDIPGLLHENPSIGHIFFNGRASQQVFLRHHRALAQRIPATLLPSTSPAAAALTFEQKLGAWRAILAALEPQERS